MERSTSGPLFVPRLLPGDQRVPDREERLVVVVDRLLAERRDLVGVPVALEVLAVLPDRRLPEVERVLHVAGEGPPLGPERHRAGGAGLPDLVPALGPEGMDVPVDVEDVQGASAGRLLLPGPRGLVRRAHAPNSARI